MPTTVALSGDSIINRRVSDSADDAVQDYLDVLREADVGVTHLEMLLPDFDREDIYPSHVSGGTGSGRPDRSPTNSAKSGSGWSPTPPTTRSTTGTAGCVPRSPPSTLPG